MRKERIPTGLIEDPVQDCSLCTVQPSADTTPAGVRKDCRLNENRRVVNRGCSMRIDSGKQRWRTSPMDTADTYLPCHAVAHLDKVSIVQ
eukprot:ANDGO_04648.mRNA.1 hypothetical protein